MAGTYRYVLSDSHGCQEVFERALGAVDLSGNNHLYLLGDYVPHQCLDGRCLSDEAYVRRCREALVFVRDFQARHAGHVTVLAGNHEHFLLNDYVCGYALGRDLLRWLGKLPYFAETERQIFVHAGIDEDACEEWRWGTSDYVFSHKHPPTFGSFYKDVVAGHVSAQGIAEDPLFEGVFWDGESHYYIDADTEHSGRMNLVRYNVERGLYQQQTITKDEVGPLLPLDGLVG